MVAWYGWVAFVGGILALLALDLLVFHREAERVKKREAAVWSAVWIGLGLGFAGVVWWTMGGDAAQAYLTGYLVEKSLSVDNLFVFLLLFRFFAVPARYQHRVLFFGILGALVLRGLFIAAGAALLASFGWIAIAFGVFLLYTAWHLFARGAVEVHPERNPVLRRIRRWFPFTTGYDGQRFLVVRDGRRMATPLLAVLVAVETTDVVFAVDSIPAIFGITRDPFLVFSSNAFAILGLRALYFFVADLAERLRYLQEGLAVVLAGIGAKMIHEELSRLGWLPEEVTFHLPAWASLVFVAIVLGGAAALSLAAGSHRSDPARRA